MMSRPLKVVVTVSLVTALNPSVYPLCSSCEFPSCELPACKVFQSPTASLRVVRRCSREPRLHCWPPLIRTAWLLPSGCPGCPGCPSRQQYFSRTKSSEQYLLEQFFSTKASEQLFFCIRGRCVLVGCQKHTELEPVRRSLFILLRPRCPTMDITDVTSRTSRWLEYFRGVRPFNA